MNPLFITLGAAVLYLRDHPCLCADPAVLVAVCDMLLRRCKPMTDGQYRQVGEMAAREVAQPVAPVVIGKLINPADLRD